MMKFNVEKRWSRDIAFTAEIDCSEDTPRSWKLRLAVLWAIKNKANLSGTNLSKANLSGTNLSKANLSRANLSKADLSRANLSESDLSESDLSESNLSWSDLSEVNLSEANLSKANLSKANLSWTNLSGANLSWTDLSWTDLSKANLSGTNLSGTDLSWTDLSKANLSESVMRHFKHDLWGILLQYQSEISGLKKAIIDGKINGSVYSGTCACLMGTIAKVKHCDVSKVIQDASSPAEQWFLQINEGQTPENHGVSRMTLEWIKEFESLLPTKN